MALVDEVKRRAARARFEAERQVRLNRAQARVGALQGQLNTSVTRLGYLVYDLAGRDEIDHPQIVPFRDQLDGLRGQISQAEAEVRAIQGEGFVEEARETACAVCGVTNPQAARFCRGCGRAVNQAYGTTGGAAEVRQEIACSNCGTASPPGMRFCLQCGTPLSPTGMPASPLPPSPAPQPSPPVPASPHGGQEAPTVLIAEAGLPPPATTADHESPGSAGAVPAMTEEDTTSEAAASPMVSDEARTSEVPAPPVIEPDPPATVSREDESLTVSQPAIEMPKAVPAEPMTVCAACGETIPTGAVFCVGCGESVIR